VFVRVKSATPVGVNALPIDVEVDISRGLPGLTIVGLAENAVKEGKERVRAALLNTGFMIKSTRITVNLAPADIKKEGSIFDLPVAVGLIAANGWINNEEIEKYIIVGELSLNGKLRGTRGILPIVILAKKMGLSVIVPQENARESAIVKDVAVYPCKNLLEVVEFLSKKVKKEAFLDEKVLDIKESYNVDFSDVKGQNFAKRALEIASSGAHNILMIGPPGSGKTLLAERLPTILPEMRFEEIIEVTKIYSVANLLRGEKPIAVERPFRSPHHTISDVALIGGGGVPRPGEISLAHLKVAVFN
jgi:magnesium chelatase family protein